MKKVEDFNTRLKPFDDLYSEMHREIRKRLEAMTESELDQIMTDTISVSVTNCAWSTFDVARIVRDIGRYVTGIDFAQSAIEPNEQPSEATAEQGGNT